MIRIVSVRQRTIVEVETQSEVDAVLAQSHSVSRKQDKNVIVAFPSKLAPLIDGIANNISEWQGEPVSILRASRPEDKIAAELNAGRIVVYAPRENAARQYSNAGGFVSAMEKIAQANGAEVIVPPGDYGRNDLVFACKKKPSAQ